MPPTLTVTESQLFHQTIVRLKEGWTKTFYARNKAGLKVSPTSSEAVCWCLRGAMTRAFFDLTRIEPLHLSHTHKLRRPLQQIRMYVETVVEELIGSPDVVACNDDYLDYVQEAIAIVERADRQFHST